MHQAEQLAQLVMLLTATVCFLLLFRRAGLSPVLGYLCAGIFIGPHGLAVIRDADTVAALAELGVIFLLFVIGLELSLERLMRMRGQVFTTGAAQVIITGCALTVMCLLAGMNTSAALIVGGGLTLSSTAVVLELLHDSPEKSTQTGRLAIATLILQDLAVIPLLVLVPLLALQGSILLALGEATIKAVIGLVLIFAISRALLRPLFHYIAKHNNQELFTTATLLVVLGLAYISTMAGLSPALGAFLGGLLVAETEFKPQVEADIMPFKGLFLGLFFTTVGMSIDIQLVMHSTAMLLGFTLTFMIVKVLIILALCMIMGFPLSIALHSGLLLCQGGEFAFVLFNLAGGAGIMDPYHNHLMTACVTLSMALTPFLHLLGRRLGQYIDRHRNTYRPLPMREVMDVRDHVVIAGFGRVGRVVAQLLEAERIPYVALDMDAGTVGTARAQGKPVYFGDSSRAIVLKAAGILRARAAVISHSDTQAGHQAIVAIRKLHGDVPIIARARNIEQVVYFEQAGATMALAEMFEASLQLGGMLLKQMGVHEAEISRIVDTFRAEDYALTRRADEAPAGPAGTPTGEYSI